LKRSLNRLAPLPKKLSKMASGSSAASAERGVEHERLQLSAISRTGLFTGRRGFVPYDMLLKMDQLPVPILIDDTLYRTNLESGIQQPSGYIVLPKNVALAFAQSGDMPSTMWWLGYDSSFNSLGGIAPESIEELERLSINPEELAEFADNFYYGMEQGLVEFEDRKDSDLIGKLQISPTAGVLV